MGSRKNHNSTGLANQQSFFSTDLAMRKNLIIFVACILLTSCDSSEEKINAHKHVRITVKVNWKIYVPLDDLVIAIDECKKYPDSYLCEKLNDQIYDISVSLETCNSQIPKSKLCTGVVEKISNHQLKNLLPQADAIALPNDPFYFSLPTKLLEAYSSPAGYRSEIWSEWIQKYQSILDTMIFWITVFLIALAWLMFCKNEKVNQAESERRRIYQEQNAVEQKLRDDESKKREEAIAEKKKITEENAARKQQAKQESIAEQNRQREIERTTIATQIEEEKQKAAEAEARVAAEKMLIEQMMAAAVKKFPKKK